MLTAVVGNESQWLFALAASTAAHYKSGRLRALAVSTKQRSPVMPELPTIEEAGVVGYDFTTWNAFFAPKGMPQRYVTAVHAAIQKAITEPDIRELYAAQSLVPRGNANPEEFARFFKADFERVGKVIKLAGIKPE
jgi:tripartite-type tricarboxylate transporter receptor subunit TctC